MIWEDEEEAEELEEEIRRQRDKQQNDINRIQNKIDISTNNSSAYQSYFQ